jgi:hypothetical protein
MAEIMHNIVKATTIGLKTRKKSPFLMTKIPMLIIIVGYPFMCISSRKGLEFQF